MDGSHFMSGQRCPYCAGKRVFRDESLGALYPECLDIWDYELNDKTPFDYYPGSSVIVHWICPKHGKYERWIQNSVRYSFICPECAKEKRHNSHSPTFIDISGQKFGTLTVESYAFTIDNRAYWNCVCECGAKVIKQGTTLKSGRITTCGDWGIHKSGENSNNWKGGITPENKAIRGSTEYNDWRKSVYRKDGFHCVICGTHDNLNAHHILPFAEYPELRFDVSNGITLCKDHHANGRDGSFHDAYGTSGNTPEQLEDYINNEYEKMGINKHFDVYEYMKGIKEMDNKENKVKWNHEFYTDEELNNYLDNNIKEPMSVYIYENRKNLDDTSVDINNENNGKFQHILPRFRVNGGNNNV